MRVFVRCTEFPIIYSNSFSSCCCCCYIFFFFDLQIFVRDIFLISQKCSISAGKLWAEWVSVFISRPQQMCNVCECVFANILSLLFHIFLISGLSKRARLVAWLAGWQQNGTLSRSVGLFVRLRSLRSIYPERAKICVSHTLTVCVCVLEYGILHFCNFIYRKRRLHIVIRYFFFCSSCDVSFWFYLLCFIARFFSFTPDSLLLLLHKVNNININSSSRKKWIETRREHLFKLQVFK